MLSGHGGIGRRVRLRGVWLHRPSSSLGDRTKRDPVEHHSSIGFFFCPFYKHFAMQSPTLELVRNTCVQQCAALFGRHRPSGARSSRYKSRDYSFKHNTKCCVRLHAGADALFAQHRPHHQKPEYLYFLLEN